MKNVKMVVEAGTKREELYRVAQVVGVKGRSRMNKHELIVALLAEGVYGVKVEGSTVVPVYGDEDMMRRVREDFGEDVCGEMKSVVEKKVLSDFDALFEALFKENDVLANLVLDAMNEGKAKSVRGVFKHLANVDSKNRLMINKFLEQYYVPKRMRLPKRRTVLVLRGDLRDDNLYRFDGDKVILDLNYDGYSASKQEADHGYIQQQESDLLRYLGWDTKHVMREIADHDVVTSVSVGERMMVMSFGENDDESRSLLEYVMQHGVYVYVDGELKHYVYLQRSNSQARVLKGIFVLNDREDVVTEVENALGMEPLVFAKDKGEGVYELDATKPDKRKGLKQTSSNAMMTFTFGKRIRRVYPGTNETVHEGYTGRYDVVLEGGEFTARFLADDVYANISRGEFSVMDRDGKRVKVLDAREYPQKMVLGDGTNFHNTRVARIFQGITGRFLSAGQFRAFDHVKGMTIAHPELEEVFDEDFVFFPSSIKGNIEATVENAKKYGRELGLSVARINPKSVEGRKYTLFPYQFTHIIDGMTVEHMQDIVRKHVQKASEMLKDFGLMKEHLAIDRFEEVHNCVSDEMLQLAEDGLGTRLAKAIYVSDGQAYHDAYFKRGAFELIELMVRKWMTGQIPVEGDYKYLLHDPLAVLDALRHQYKYGGLRDDDGDIIIPQEMGLGYKQAVISVADEEGAEMLHEGHVSLFRNPSVAEGEAGYVKCVREKRYAKYVKQGYFANVTILSAHDFELVRMGGADVDGDTAFVVFEEIINELVSKMTRPAVLDRYCFEVDGKLVFGDGCPYEGSGEDETIPNISHLVEKQEGYKVYFTREQYQNPELRKGLHALEKHYVLKTLKQNKIGYLTNSATILADMKRRLINALHVGKDIYGRVFVEDGNTNEHAHSRKWYKELIEDFEEKIFLLRFAQGWEIDRAKHGGAYEEALADKLAFVSDMTKLPPLVSFVSDEEKGTRKWIKPLWFKVFNKTNTPTQAMNMARQYYQENPKRKEHVPSLLNGFFNSMLRWFKGFEAEYEQMSRDYQHHNLLNFFSRLSFDNEKVTEAIKKLWDVKHYYNTEVSELMQNIQKDYEKLHEELNADLIDHALYEIRAEILEDERNDRMQMIIDTAKSMLNQVGLDEYDEELVAYAAYTMTYARRGNVSSPSFPWVIIDEGMMRLLVKARKAFPVSDGNEELITFDKPVKIQAFTSPSGVEKGYTKERIVAALNSTKAYGAKAVFISGDKTPDKKDAFYLYVYSQKREEFVPVAKFYSTVAQKYFAGHAQVDLQFAYATHNKSGYTLTLNVTQMIKR